MDQESPVSRQKSSNFPYLDMAGYSGAQPRDQSKTRRAIVEDWRVSGVAAGPGGIRMSKSVSSGGEGECECWCEW